MDAGERVRAVVYAATAGDVAHHIAAWNLGGVALVEVRVSVEYHVDTVAGEEALEARWSAEVRVGAVIARVHVKWVMKEDELERG